MAVYVDIARGALVVPNLYCRVKVIGGNKISAHYQIELKTSQHGGDVPILDITQTHYTFADRDGAPEFDITSPPWPQIYADLKDRFRNNLLVWCSAMREEDGSPV